jgi:hypothetical protein
MTRQQLYNKAAQLLDRADNEDGLMRGIYEDLARSYFRMASQADRRVSEQAGKEQRDSMTNQVLAQLLAVLSDGTSSSSVGVPYIPSAAPTTSSVRLPPNVYDI